MPIEKLLGLTSLAKPLTSEEGRAVLTRDRYRCQYCGLDGIARFEDSLIMTVDFVHPRAHKGKKTRENLVTACRPCNTIKGRRVFRDFAEAKAYVLQQREELRKEWTDRTAHWPSPPVQTQARAAAK
jgi:5-methylcytosine-specific restriction endonuclease McrA